MNFTEERINNLNDGEKVYMGVKQIIAKPMSLFDYRVLKGLPAGEGHKSEGYIVYYSDEYYSWSPKEVFENFYAPMTNSTKITIEDLKAFIKDKKVEVRDLFGARATFVEVELINGFVIVEYSKPAVDSNFDQVQGERICMEKIYKQMWSLLGFMLASAKGLNLNK